MTREHIKRTDGELLPCPFCGSDPMPDFCSTTDGPAYLFHCQSKDCPAWPSVQGETEAEAIAAWNTRPTEAAPELADEPRVCVVRDHCVSPQHNLDRVKLSLQRGPLGSFDRADGELLARLWNAALRRPAVSATPDALRQQALNLDHKLARAADLLQHIEATPGYGGDPNSREELRCYVTEIDEARLSFRAALQQGDKR